MVKKWFMVYGLWFMAIFASNLVHAQDIDFRASVDKNRITLDDQVELTLTVSGSQDVGAPQLPQMDGFQIISTGSSSQFSFINGKMSVSKSFTYILMPLKEGRLTIPPATIEVGGRTLKTESIEIEVVKGTRVPQAPAQPQAPPSVPPVTPSGLRDRIFIEVTTDKQTGHIGEQITMTFRLYHRNVMIDNLEYTPPVTKDFVTEAMGPQREYRTVVNGVVYDVIELKTAIFPVTNGELTIEPARLRCDLLVRTHMRRPRHGDVFDDFFEDFFEEPFFGSYTRYPVELESQPIKLNINPLPNENKPDSFKGAVGRYDLQIEANPTSLKAGEPINLSMKISGAGNIAQVQEPVIKDLTGFKAYESEVKTDITGRDPQIAGIRTFQKIIIPQDENVKEIPVIEFSYFDPELNQYRTIKKGPIPITVAPASKKETEIVELIKELTPEEEVKKQVKLLAKDIQFIKTSLGRVNRLDQYWYKNKWLWVIIVLVPLWGIGFSYAYKTHRARLSQDIAYARARSAHKIARQLLSEAIRYQKENKPKEFYDAIAKAIQKFISNRLNIPIGAVTPELLITKGIDIAPIKDLLETCDMVRFGSRSVTQQEMKMVIKDVERIIGMLSKKL